MKMTFQEKAHEFFFSSNFDNVWVLFSQTI